MTNNSQNKKTSLKRAILTLFLLSIVFLFPGGDVSGVAYPITDVLPSNISTEYTGDVVNIMNSNLLDPNTYINPQNLEVTISSDGAYEHSFTGSRVQIGDNNHTSTHTISFDPQHLDLDIDFNELTGTHYYYIIGSRSGKGFSHLYAKIRTNSAELSYGQYPDSFGQDYARLWSHDGTESGINLQYVENVSSSFDLITKPHPYYVQEEEDPLSLSDWYLTEVKIMGDYDLPLFDFRHHNLNTGVSSDWFAFRHFGNNDTFFTFGNFDDLSLSYIKVPPRYFDSVFVSSGLSNYTPQPGADFDLLAVQSITDQSARLRGEITAVDDPAGIYTITLHMGTTSNINEMFYSISYLKQGNDAIGTYSHNVFNLNPGTEYFYTMQVNGSFAPVESFFTGSVWPPPEEEWPEVPEEGGAFDDYYTSNSDENFLAPLPIFETLGGFIGNMFGLIAPLRDYFHNIVSSGEAYSQGETAGSIIPTARGFLLELDPFFGGVPVSLAVSIFILLQFLMLGLKIIKTIYELIPFI